MSFFPNLPELLFEEGFQLSRPPTKITLFHQELGDFELNPELWTWDAATSRLRLRFLPPSHRRVLELRFWDQHEKLILRKKIQSTFRFRIPELQQDLKVRGRFSSSFFLFRFRLSLPLLPSHHIVMLGAANRAGEVFATFMDPGELGSSSVVFDLTKDGRHLILSQNHQETDTNRLVLFDLLKGTSRLYEFPLDRLRIHHEVLFEGGKTTKLIAASETKFVFVDPWEVLQGLFRLKTSWRDSLVRVDLERMQVETIWKHPWEMSLFNSKGLRTLRPERGFEWTEMNSISPHPKGWLVSLRNLSRINLISHEGRLLRQWPAQNQEPFSHGQHQVTWLESSGRLLFFQNGRTPEVSSLREVDPESGRVLWQWTGPYHSHYRGSVQVVDQGRALLALFPRFQDEQDTGGL